MPHKYCQDNFLYVFAVHVADHWCQLPALLLSLKCVAFLKACNIVRLISQHHLLHQFFIHLLDYSFTLIFI